MISDLSKMMEAIDAATDHSSAKHVAALERDVAELTPDQRSALAKELVESGSATLRLNGHSFRLQVKQNPVRVI
jgi:hypothetical protein